MFNLKGVALPEHLVAALSAYLKQTGDKRSVDDVVAVALRAWLDVQGAVLRGYQWKSLFLPEGTQLRLFYQGRTYIAQVRGDKIHHGGSTWSPRQWVMHVFGCVRNAWMEIWLRCPGDERWHLADSRRRLLRRYPDMPLPKAPSRTSAAEALQANPAPPAWNGEERRASPRPDTSATQHMAVAHQGWRRAVFHQHPKKNKRKRGLRRGDMLREDQPDLRPRKRVYPRRHQAGRPGLADRRKPAQEGYLGRRNANAPPMRAI